MVTHHIRKCFCLLFLFFFFFLLYSHFVYIKIACCWVVRGGGGGLWNLSQKTHSEVCKCCLCISVCKYIYTKHSCTKKKKTLCGTPSLAKNKQRKKKQQKKYQLLSLAYSFFLWIYGSSDTVIMDFVHLINRTTQSWAVLRKRSAEGAIVREKRFLHTGLSTPHYCNSSGSGVY